MWTVALPLLLLASVGYCHNNNTEAMAHWEACTKTLRSSGMLQPENVPLAKVLYHCHHLRTELTGCLSHKMKLTEDDGSKASRGKILVDLIDRTGRDREIVQIARYYHYACVYNDVGIWIRNSTCYSSMLNDCVFKDNDCYGMRCRTADNETILKYGLRDENTAGSHHLYASYMWAIALMTY